MLSSRGIGLIGHGLRCIRPTPPRLQSTRQLSQCSSSKNLLFSKTPSRPTRPSHISLATIGRANISLWPWSSSKQEGLGFTPPPATREGTPEPSSVSPNNSELATDAKGAATAAPDPPQPIEPANVVDSTMESTPLPLDSADEAVLAALQSPIITEDHYGFLREMGLHYGFPYITNTLQIIMENIHIHAGTDWWGTIALSAIVVRCIMVVPMAIGSHHMAKMELIKPYTKIAQEKLAKAKESKDAMAMQEAQKEVTQLMKAVGYKMAWPLAPMVLQGLFGYCAFKLMRAMTKLPVPGLETGGALWFLDLTVPDPYFIIPVVMGGLMHLIAKLGGELGSRTELSAIMKNAMLYYLPGFIAFVVVFQPAALQVSFLTAMMWGAGQGYLFRRPWFRHFFKMEALPSKFTQGNVRAIATENLHQPKVAAPTSGKPVRTLRTVKPAPLKYEAPRARAQREMAVFHPPKELGTKTPQKPAASKGIISTVVGDVTSVPEKLMESTRKLTGMAAPPTAKQQRMEEYERRRMNERKYEAETRRQGKR